MPELPEVETVARLIRPGLVGRRIESCRVHWRRTLGASSIARFERAVVGARVARVWRRAKYIVFDLTRARRPAGHLLGHLRMTGRMQILARGADPGRFAKVELALDDGRVFHFIDVRKFGRLEFVASAAEALAQLGPEPLEPEFTPAVLHALLSARQRALKPLLLDQTLVAGLGNIYVDEALFRARLHPLANSRRVDAEQARELHGAIQSILRAAIEREGSSFDTFYRTPEGQPGSYQDRFEVYGRTGEPCTRCSTPIERLVIGQRGTHVCPRCQPRPRRRAGATGRRAP